MLKVAFASGEDILKWCTSKENLHYLREHTRLLDRVYYFKLEQDLWQNYIVYGETYHCWTSSLSNTIIQQNQVTSDYQQSLKSTEKYQHKIKQQLQDAEEHVEQHALLLKNYQQQDSMYEHRKILYKTSAKDHHCVKVCYDCQPIQDEITSMQIIWQATINECKSQEEVDILKQHLYIKRLPKSFDYLDESFSKIENKLARPIYNDNTRTTISTHHRKIIAQNKFDLMKLYINMAEAAVRGYRQYGEDEKQNLINRMIKDPCRQVYIEQFIKAIEERQNHIRQHTQYQTQRRIHFFYRRSDDHRKHWHRRSSYRLNLYWDILPSSPIIEVFTKLTSEQLALLARGPKYVPPCQIQFYRQGTKEKIIEQEHKIIIDKITEFFYQNCYSISEKRIQDFSSDIKNLLQRLYTKKLSRKLYIRAKRERKLIINIRRYLRQYMQETEAYEQITSGISPLAANLEQVISLLNRLYNAQKPLITKKQYEAMYPKLVHTELAHLYFLPKPHKIGTPLRPIVASIHAPAMLVSIYLDNRLRPLFNRVARQTTYISSTDFVQQLEKHQIQGHLLPTTNFITADVKNLYTMIPRGGALDTLHRFCVKHSKEYEMANLNVNTIIRLACLVLETNCFVFDNKYYKQIRGGAMGSPFTMTLANIYMYEWEQSLIQYQQARNELYGRYIDDIFMTSNESIEKIQALLEKEDKKDPNIRINYTIQQSVEFLDVFIENIQGKLKTSVFRKPAAEPYILPYTSDHPRHIHSNTIYTALLRAIRLCSDVDTFNQERLNIEIVLLLNGHPPKFIKHHFQQFFKKNNVASIYKDLHEETYQQFHKKLLNECQVKDPSSEQQQPQQQQSNKKKTDQKDTGKPVKKERQLIIHCTYESGPLKTFNRDFLTIWKKHFCYDNSTLSNVHVILGTRTNKILD
ncbi:unnamed protein product [Rotaria socialis]|uniref:Reverse transcriptase domain-containing protein n=4 Tax=Rotaria socialis TaxID=392032 RepID=A0A820WJ50_9BILA|nr:unnamed protein product [Rotaria socialis]